MCILTKLNKYQKLILIIYGLAFMYFSVIHVPFKIKGKDGIAYDTLFSERANLDISRLLLILVIISVALAIIFVLINSLHLNLKLQLRQKLKYRPTLYILLVIAVVGASLFFLTKKHITVPTTVETSTDTTAIDMISDTSKVVDKVKSEPLNYNITNVKFYSNENFEEFVSFTFQNTSSEVITNIMFKEAYFPVKKKKSDFTNKKSTLKPNDSTRFIFKKDHDELSVYRLRFVTGKTITLDDGFLNYENMIYSKF